MSIEQLIDQLSELGQTIGMKAEVKAWNLAHEQRPMEPLGVRNVSDVSAGWDKSSNKPVATLRLT
jgi:hypothetical protein